jgi:hypothetical protein
VRFQQAMPPPGQSFFTGSIFRFLKIKIGFAETHIFWVRTSGVGQSFWHRLELLVLVRTSGVV